jgi:hypothetical protein
LVLLRQGGSKSEPPAPPRVSAPCRILNADGGKPCFRDFGINLSIPCQLSYGSAISSLCGFLNLALVSRREDELGAEVNDLTLDLVAARLWSRVDLVQAFDTWRGGGGAAPAAPRPNRRERFGAPLAVPRRPDARPDENDLREPVLD